MLKTPFRKMVGITLICSSILLIKNYYGGTYCKVTRDLTGQIAIITGGNTGIGKQTAIGLASQGCEVIIAARDVQKSLDAVEEIKKITKNTKIHFLPLDLGSKESIDDFAQEIHQEHQKINILVNNAGVMRIPERKLTIDGFEMQFGVNHLGHFYLTSKLWDMLKKAKNPRIINVSSRAHTRVVFGKTQKVDLDWKNLNFDYDYDPGLAYSRSKLANILFTQQLASKLEKTLPEARCVALHPGVVRTEIARYAFQGLSSLLKIFIYPLGLLFFKSPKQGAQTTLFTVFQSADKLENGKYYAECQVEKTNQFAHNKDNQKILWKFSEKMLGIEFDAD